MKKYLRLYKVLGWISLSLISIVLLLSGFAYVFKDKIIAASITELNKYLDTKIDIDPKIELSLFAKFPQASVEFNAVKIYESIPNSEKLLGEAEHVYLSFNLKNIFDGNYIVNSLSIENGHFDLVVDKNGRNNYSILKKDTTSSESSGFDLHNISLKNVSISYRNETNDQYYSVLSNSLKADISVKNSVYQITLQGAQHVQTISINKEAYFKEKDLELTCSLSYNQSTSLLVLQPTTVLVEKALFAIEGKISFGEKNSIALTIENKVSSFTTLLSLIPQTYTAQFASYKTEGDVYFNAKINGISSPTENPAIEVTFGSKDASFLHPTLPSKITDATFYGVFSNGVKRNTATSYIALENIRFVFDNKLIQGGFLFRNFEQPYIAFDATGSVDVSSLLAFYPIADIKSAKGQLDFDIDFKGALADLKKREGHSRIEASGELQLNNLSIQPAKVSVSLNNLSGNFLFTKNDVAINNFSAKIGKTDLAVSGMLRNVFGIVLLDNSRMLADIKVASSFLDVEELLAFQPDEQEPEVSDVVEPKEAFPYLEKYVFDLTLALNDVRYKKVTMTNVKGKLSFNQPVFRAENCSFSMAGGLVNTSGLINFVSENNIQTTIKAQLEGLNIDKFLYSFDNFGQTFITHEHLKGEFKGAVETYFNWNSKGTIDTKSIVTSIDCSITKGELNGFEPMQNLARFIDASELAKIKFSELKNTVYIENRMITLPEMQILSNVSEISVAGSHSFDNVMDYKLAVPLKNLKRHKVDKDAAFGAIEEDSKKGSTLFLTIKGPIENYKIGYDTKRTKTKITEDLKKEKKEFFDLFKKKEGEVQQKVKPNQEEFFDFD